MDIDTAAILLREEGPLPMVAFHIQQAIEKNLKGLLISFGITPRRTHDLEDLIESVIEVDSEFQTLLGDCQRITEYYIEARYPTGVTTSLQTEALETDFRVALHIAALVFEKTSL